MAKRDDFFLGLLAVRAALAADAQRFLLPQQLLGRQAAQLEYPETGIQQRREHELFFRGLARMAEPIGFFGAQRLPHVLVGHRETSEG